MTHMVYWLYDETCRDHRTDGYVGCTTVQGRPKSKGHHQRKKYPDAKFKILFTGTKKQCQKLERELRPTANIGWNVQRGGRASGMLGKVHKISTIRKMRMSVNKRREAGTLYRGGNGGHRHTEKTKAKIRAARLRQADPRLGTKHSLEARERMRLARLANPQPRDPITGLMLPRE